MSLTFCTARLPPVIDSEDSGTDGGHLCRSWSLLPIWQNERMVGGHFPASSSMRHLTQRIPPALRSDKALAVLAAAAGQLIMFAGMAIVSRRYGQIPLSQYGVMFSLFNIAQLAATLRLEQGLVYEKADDGRRALYRAALWLLLPATVTICLASFFYVASNPQTSSQSVVLVLVLAMATAFAGTGRLNVQMLAAVGRSRAVVISNFARPSVIGLSQVAASVFGSSVVDLMLALAFGQAVYAGLMWILARTVTRGHRVEPSDIRRAISRNSAFPLYSLPQNLVYTASEALVPLSIPFLFPGSKSVAFFWLASRAVFAPATVMAESIRSLVYKDLADQADLRKRIVVYSVALALPIAFGMIILYLFGDTLFRLLFGPQWGPANDYALVLGVMVVFNMACLPIVGALPLLNLQRGLFIFEVLGGAARAATLFLVVWTSPLALVASATAVYMVVMGLFFAYALAASGRYVKLV